MGDFRWFPRFVVSPLWFKDCRWTEFPLSSSTVETAAALLSLLCVWISLSTSVHLSVRLSLYPLLCLPACLCVWLLSSRSAHTNAARMWQLHSWETVHKSSPTIINNQLSLPAAAFCFGFVYGFSSSRRLNESEKFQNRVAFLSGVKKKQGAAFFLTAGDYYFCCRPEVKIMKHASTAQII